jgi:membrane carboxypeptidase/penicillin-binding protein
MIYNKVKVLLPAILFLIGAYYAGEILHARAHTIETADGYLAQADIYKDDLSSEQLEILLKVQDPNFYDHKGVEFHTPGSGWTTITQSLAKKFYFKDYRQGLPKIKQTLCARFALHPLVSKERQITLFLNMMYFGNNQYGIVDAADYYYSKEVNTLKRDEYLSLIASLIAPAALNVEDDPHGNLERVERIKKLLSGEYKAKGVFDIIYDKAE